jgi:predicted RNA-binding Zn ribbon-like protein
MSRDLPSVEHLELVGGRLCLDFVNTVNRTDGRCRDERLRTCSDIFRWSLRLGLIDTATAERLAAEAAAHPRKAALALQSVVEFRDRLWRVLSRADIEEAERLLPARSRRTLPRMRALRNGDVVLDAAGGLAGWLLAALYGSALEVLTTTEPERVKVCPGHRCGWLFLDESPARVRKWCSMKACGNRQKAREHYRRRNAS